MNENQLKITIGLSIIISHFLIIILIIFLRLLFKAFLFEEMTTTIALIIPMFSVYTTAIIKYIIANKNITQNEDVEVSRAYAFTSIMIPSIFVFFILFIILLKAFNVGFTSFDQFKIMLVLSETAFGTYVGIILTSMFNINKDTENP